MKTKLLLLGLALFSMPVLAGGNQQISLPVGHTSTVTLPANAVKVILEKPKLVEAKIRGRRVEFLGKEAGYTEATVVTSSGKFQFRVYVAQDRFAMP